MGDVRARKIKTQDERVYDTLGGIAAGGATAMLVMVSTATTVSMLKQATPVVPATAGPSVVVPLMTTAAISATPPAQLVAAPAAKFAESHTPKIAAAPASRVSAPVAAAVTRAVVPAPARIVSRTATPTVVKLKKVVPTAKSQSARNPDARGKGSFHGYSKSKSVYSVHK